jgi:phosphate transport system substrate-binding protein
VKKILAVLLSVLYSLLAFSCTPSFCADRIIAVVTREDGSGTKTAFMEILGLKGQRDPKDVLVSASTAGVLAAVKQNGQAIGYESFAFVGRDVRILKIDNVECTAENIRSGEYRLSRPLKLVFRESSVSGGLNRLFLNFLSSREAEKIIESSGFVSVRGRTVNFVAARGVRGKINISGSTSLRSLMESLAERFEALQPYVSVYIAGGGSGTGYINAENGTSHFGMISEDFVSVKAKSCTYFTVARDGIAVIVNKKNTFDNLSLEQLRSIYDRNEETRFRIWKDLI